VVTVVISPLAEVVLVVLTTVFDDEDPPLPPPWAPAPPLDPVGGTGVEAAD
jgi:hypothetical protein